MKTVFVYKVLINTAFSDTVYIFPFLDYECKYRLLISWCLQWIVRTALYWVRTAFCC